MAIKSTREAVIRALTELAREDERYVLVSPDAMAAARALPFQETFPGRVFEVGIAEQDAVAFAAGLASTGLVPFVITYAGFLTMRACEQLRTFVAYPGLKVRLVGLNGGVFGGEREGVTHQFFEDVGIVRTIPGITVVTPSDANAAYSLAKQLDGIDGPVYLRIGSGREREVYGEDESFALGKLTFPRDYGRDVCVFSSGFVLNRAIDAVEQLRREGIHAVLADTNTMKPLDEAAVAELLADCGCAVTIEDHNIIGGLGSAICETASKLAPVPVARIGLQDRYPRSGHPEDLLDYCGITARAVVDGAKSVMGKKQGSLK